jgi:hypothetical protein
MTLVTRRRSDQTQQTAAQPAQLYGKENEMDMYIQDSQAPWDEGSAENSCSYFQKKRENHTAI